MKKTWQYFEQDESKSKEFSKKYSISEKLATMLINRGCNTEEKIEKFLNPTRKDFYDPYLLKDMEKAVERIIKAIKNKEKTIIYGDYDADGITSITVLKKFLNQRGLNVDYHIPNRLEEGYGLNKQAIEKISQDGYTLMITVDCGISGINDVDYANSLKIETIITDHHETLPELPNAVAVVNPKRKDSNYPFRGLAGVGVVFKLIQAISIKLELDEKEYLKFLDLVCIGTISDIVPLIDENRVISKLGLLLVERTKNIGLRELIKASGFTKIDSNTISFGIAPRINACGRMGVQEEALRLFITEDLNEASKITKKLNEFNKLRQDTEKEILKEALDKLKDEEDNNCIILAGEHWHHGVIGIVASKITETYYKPSLLLCLEGDLAKGSGRSIKGFDLHEALYNCNECLEKYGGHAMAVGLSLKRSKFEEFKNKMENYARKFNIKDIPCIIYIDEEITYKDLNKEFIKEIKLLEPYGEANKIPIFIYKNLKIDSIRTLTDGKHLKLTLKDESKIINAIGFNMGNIAENYLIGDKVDIIGMLEENEYNGNYNIQINLVDIRKSYT